MTFYVNPELCIPVFCAGFVVLVICTALNTVLNIVNTIVHADSASPSRRHRHD